MILLILVSAFVGIAFKRLAEKYNKSITPFIILGLLVFIITYFLSGVLIGLIIYAIGNRIEDFNPFVLELAMLVIGMICSFITYKILIKIWKNQQLESDILDDLPNIE